MHQKSHCHLFSKALLLLIGLLSSAIVFANQTETSRDQNNIINSKILPIETLNRQNAKPSINNPNAALVAMAFKFNRIDGLPNTYAEVVANYCKQAKTGDADAFFALAWMYENGKGISADKSIAAQLYAKAAEQGHKSAQQSLARFVDV